MRRGSRAHAVLETTLRRLKDATGSARADAGVAARGAARRSTRRSTASSLEGARGRRRGGRSRPTCSATCATRPSAAPGSSRTHLEWRFGREGDEHGPLALGELRSPGGSTASTSARAARRSCATTRARARPPGAGWAEGGALQVALYMLAARDLLGLEPVGGLYQALWARDSRPRGLVRDDVPGATWRRTSSPRPSWRPALDEVRDAGAGDGARAAGGRVRACPEKCSPKGCAYPTICRAGG